MKKKQRLFFCIPLLLFCVIRISDCLFITKKNDPISMTGYIVAGVIAIIGIVDWVMRKK
ncbi:MAG: hypothetical protein J6J44_04570 [Lachnospiraceae bacterium]|nr:hypothetical protein [Lachnospiraceae bacterium]